MKVSGNLLTFFWGKLGDQRPSPVKYYLLITALIKDNEKLLVLLLDIESKKSVIKAV